MMSETMNPTLGCVHKKRKSMYCRDVGVFICGCCSRRMCQYCFSEMDFHTECGIHCDDCARTCTKIKKLYDIHEPIAGEVYSKRMLNDARYPFAKRVKTEEGYLCR